MGDYGAALLAYRDFVRGYPDSTLRQTAYELVQMMFAQTQVNILASHKTCEEINSFTDIGLLPEPDTSLPLFYLACGALYDASGEHNSSFEMYTTFLTESPQHPQAPEAIASLLINPVACHEIVVLQANQVIANQTALMPRLYFRCGKAYDNQERFDDSFSMYKNFLMKYPEHKLAAKAEKALLANPELCGDYWTLQDTIVAERDDFMANLYFGCGRASEDAGDYADALRMYEHFLVGYAEHELADKVQAAYARIIVHQTRASETSDLGEPQQVGSMEGKRANVVVHNATPERLRIVFSGPDPHIEELEACKNCRKYSQDEFEALTSCPEDASSGTYQLKSGDYDVVIESLSDPGVTPFSGDWDLEKGMAYLDCIVLVKRPLP